MTKASIKRSLKIVDQKKHKKDIVEWGNIAFIEPEPKKKIELADISLLNLKKRTNPNMH